MAIFLNHTIIPAIDNELSANFLAEILGLSTPTTFGPFVVVQTENEVSLDFRTTSEKITPRHYAFLVSEQEFDEIFARIRERNLTYWADHQLQHAGEINHNDGGRGCYFKDPNKHLLEIITRPYGSGA